MWSTDFPHNESTYGYSTQSLAAVVDAVGAEAGTAIVGGNVKRYPRAGRLMPAGLMASAHRRRGSRRMRTSPECSGTAGNGSVALMREQGLDALVLLGNTNVVYATGAIWPLADSGRANFEQPVAVVLADDEWPHLFSPMREDDGLRTGLPADHLHGPVYLDFDEGVQLFASRARRPRAGRRRDRGSTSGPTPCAGSGRSCSRPIGCTVDGGRSISEAKAIKTPDELSCMREGLRITERAIAEVQARRRSRRPPDRPHRNVSAHDLRSWRRRQRPRPDLAGHARPDRGRAVDDDRRSRLPAPLDRARAGRRRCPVGRHRHQLCGIPLRLRADLGRRPRTRCPPACAVRAMAVRSWTPSSTSPGPERRPRI